MDQPLQQEFKWRELDEQRKAERLHKRLQQEQVYLLSLQHESKQQHPADRTAPSSEPSHTPQALTLPPAFLPTPRAQVIDAVVSLASEPPRVPQITPSDRTVPEKTDETSTRQISPSQTPQPSVSETPTDSKSPKAESLEPDRISEPVRLPIQPIREVNLLLRFLLLSSSSCSASCLPLPSLGVQGRA